MKLLIFGQTGQVASELARLEPNARFLSRADADLTNPAACAQIINTSDADAIINAAAYTAVDKAETETDLAFQVNGAAPTEMAKAAAAKGIPFIHISTDYVFNGQGTKPWTPDDPLKPLGIYGQSKLAGETGVRAAGGAHVILRTSWVVSAHGSNFVKTMLRLAQSLDTLRVVSDQIGGPTPAAAIAKAVVEIAAQLVTKQNLTGTYHFAGAPDVSWADFARAIFAEAGQSVTVEDIPAKDYPTPAKRPQNSRLDCTSLERAFGIKRPDWRAGLQQILADIKEQIS
ncbi:MAG: dTDP-4-dehydrorhamnose reductase [Alphaproteobacteria bacterium]|nr:dTDP-4-dehydrorhamnose reductase [Alphaproteobacteria bacterium]